MSDSNSEEKTLPPSQHKLRKQREKGNVVTSKDTVSSVLVAAVLAYLYARRDWISEKMGQLFALDGTELEQGFWFMLQAKIDVVWTIGLQVVVPVFVMVIFVSIILGMTIAGGPLFSVEPLTPKFEKINPAAGLKRIFGRRAMMTFLMHVVRLVLMSAAFGFIVVAGWSAMIRAPICGFGCVTQVLENNALPIVIAAAILMGATAVMDFLVQRMEFLRSQKMSVTERRREYKDMEGDAQIKARRANIGFEMMDTPTGAKRANILISDAPREIVGVRYVEGETPAPLIVIRAKGPDACKRLEQNVDVPTYSDRELSLVLSKTSVGDYIFDDAPVMALAGYFHKATTEN